MIVYPSDQAANNAANPQGTKVSLQNREENCAPIQGTAEVLAANFFCRFGIPRELRSDQGRNFESHLLRVSQRLGVSKTRTTPLHPQSDGMVERYIKTIEEHLRKFVASHQRDRDERLPLFLLAYRTSIHDTTGLNPASLVFGRELRLPCGLLVAALRRADHPSKESYRLQNDQENEKSALCLKVGASEKMNTQVQLTLKPLTIHQISRKRSPAPNNRATNARRLELTAEGTETESPLPVADCGPILRQGLWIQMD
ncbi:hypothetical protein B7P43_G07850 [Cryptotermes secundus]|uniref:Integrase catalytic domain-containing protein n=1 Tax=Cryptotermes secundus TaxID=105785 RepID=A0A2J7QF18_9NEOP|nr:hypothetical protein B7P43_G07850 [Cryptotermes secundus]